MFFFNKKEKAIKVLSIDGGGIRGLIPAIILQHLQEQLRLKGNNKPFCEIFDLMSGTSTGALIALGLAAPKENLDKPGTYLNEPAYDISTVVKIYSQLGNKIFPKWRFNALQSVVQAIKDKYDPAELEKILDELFAKRTIDDSLTNILVTAYDTENRKPFFFKKRPTVDQWDRDLNFYMKDAARASSAAPTFFSPAYIPTVPDSGKKYCLIDGGIAANNPAMCAYIEARKIYPDAKKFIIVSIGTGESNLRYLYEDIKSWGYLDWVSPVNATPLPNFYMDAQVKTANHQLHKLPGVDFVRFECNLPWRTAKTDDASDETIISLMKLANQIISEDQEQIQYLCKIL